MTFSRTPHPSEAPTSLSYGSQHDLTPACVANATLLSFSTTKLSITDLTSVSPPPTLGLGLCSTALLGTPFHRSPFQCSSSEMADLSYHHQLSPAPITLLSHHSLASGSCLHVGLHLYRPSLPLKYTLYKDEVTSVPFTTPSPAGMPTTWRGLINQY